MAARSSWAEYCNTIRSRVIRELQPTIHQLEISYNCNRWRMVAGIQPQQRLATAASWSFPVWTRTALPTRPSRYTKWVQDGASRSELAGHPRFILVCISYRTETFSIPDLQQVQRSSILRHKSGRPVWPTRTTAV